MENRIFGGDIPLSLRILGERTMVAQRGVVVGV